MKCVVCGKMSSHIAHMRNHIETHIKGLSYRSNQCGKVNRSSHSLSVHVSTYHKNNSVWFQGIWCFASSQFQMSQKINHIDLKFTNIYIFFCVGATISIGRTIQCLPYVRFFSFDCLQIIWFETIDTTCYRYMSLIVNTKIS